MSDTLIDSYSETNQDFDSSIYSGAYTGQALTLGNAWNITSVKFYLKKAGSPTGSAYAKIYAVTGTVGTDGRPTGSVLATSGALDVATLTTGYALIELSFSGYAASAGDYCVILEYGSGNTSNKVLMGLDNSSPSHDGNMCRYYSGAWSGYNTYDCCFYLYGTTSGWGGKVCGVSSPGKVIGVEDIGKVDGVE